MSTRWCWRAHKCYARGQGAHHPPPPPVACRGSNWRQAHTSATSAKLLFGATTPWLCSNTTDALVQQLNGEAAAIMQAHSIPTVDFHKAITGHCGYCMHAWKESLNYKGGEGLMAGMHMRVGRAVR